MPTTTNYGTWCNRVDECNLTVEDSVHGMFVDGADDWDVPAIVVDYRRAINAALPPSVSLCGDEFYGPYYAKDQDFSGYPKDELGRLDIQAIVEDVDLWAIVRRHEIQGR